MSEWEQIQKYKCTIWCSINEKGSITIKNTLINYNQFGLIYHLLHVDLTTKTMWCIQFLLPLLKNARTGSN